MTDDTRKQAGRYVLYRTKVWRDKVRKRLSGLVRRRNMGITQKVSVCAFTREELEAERDRLTASGLKGQALESRLDEWRSAHIVHDDAEAEIRIPDPERRKEAKARLALARNEVQARADRQIELLTAEAEILTSLVHELSHADAGMLCQDGLTALATSDPEGFREALRQMETQPK